MAILALGLAVLALLRSPAQDFGERAAALRGRLGVCTENLIRVEDVMNSPKLAE